MNKIIGGLSVLREGLVILCDTAAHAGAYLSHDHKDRVLLTYHDAYIETLGSIAMLADLEKEVVKKSVEENCKTLFELIIAHNSSHGSLAPSQFAISDHQSVKEIVQRFNANRLLNQEQFLNYENLSGIACQGFELIRPSHFSPATIDHIVWGLALIGIGSLSIRKTAKCKFCPRRSRVGGRYCVEHSQSDPSERGRTKTKQYLQYRAGKNAYALSLTLCTQWKLHAIELTGLGDMSHRILMSEILLASYAESFDERILLLRMALEKAPRVVKLLGGEKQLSLSYPLLIRCIRERLNPYISEELSLEYVIFDFETWLELEEKVLPGHRGNGAQTLKKIDQAIALAKKGIRQTEIARELNVARSTVYGWVSKYKILSDALNEHNTEY